MIKHIKHVGDLILELPKRNVRQSLAILLGLKINCFQNCNMAEIIVKLIKSWPATGQLMISLHCITQRSRLSIIYPTIVIDHPFRIRKAEEFLLDAEKIDDFYDLEKTMGFTL